MKRVIIIILCVLLGLVVVAGISFGIYAYRNMNYDKNDEKIIQQAGFVEKQAELPDGTVLNYGEGPNNGPPLFLIHGQMTQWEDYVKVLPELSKHFHIFAVDCHGHGESSKNPKKYTAQYMGEDFTWFIENVIGQPAIVSGHSSGGLLTVWLASNSPENVLGIVLEDPPLFATEPGRAENTFAWKGFELIHNFLNQSVETNYTRYYLEHTYMQNLVGKGWDSFKKAALKYLEKHPSEPVRLFFMPPSINRSFDLLVGPYDLRFGETFYDYSWLEGFDQAESLKKIQCPAVIIHTNWSYDDNGILLAAMDDKDAARAHELVEGSKLININSGHNVHYDKPKEFIEVILEFLEKELPQYRYKESHL